MVNTFLLSKDFQFSASLLDSKRLGKQRVEAMQILNIIHYHRAIRNMFFHYFLDNDGKQNIYCPNSLSDVLRESKEIYSRSDFPTLYRYNKSENVFFVHENYLYFVPSIDPLEIDPNDHHAALPQYFSNIQEFSDGEISKFSEIKLGFSNHPCVRMWYWSPEFLKHFCNCHIYEFERRGYHNNLQYYQVDLENSHLPSWYYEDRVYESFLRTLIHKEPNIYLPVASQLGYSDIYSLRFLDWVEDR